MKKILSLALAFIIIIGALPLNFAYALDSGKCGDNLSWSFVGGSAGTLTIEGSGKMYNYSEDNPAPWHNIGDIYHLNLPFSIESIGDYAFSDLMNLRDSIVLPSSVTYLGEGAFKNCYSLKSVSIPYAVKEIKAETFSSCSELQEVLLNDITVGDTTNGYETLGVTKIGNEAFSYCTSLESIAFPSCLKEIGSGAFDSCSNLNNTQFKGKNVERIGEGAFFDCASLKSFEISNKVKAVEKDTFSGSGISEITLSESVAKVGESAFSFCDDLNKIIVKNKSCVFYDKEDTIDNAVIYCKANASVKSYAKKYSKSYYVYCTGNLLSHYYKTSVKKASGAGNGAVSKICSSCGDVASTTVINKISTATLTTTKYTYNGKVKKPAVKVVDSAGKVISSSNYTLSYSSSNPKYVGKYSVKITYKGNYTGSMTRYYYILPKGTKITKVTSGTGKLGVYWSKQSTQTSGYQIQLCKSKSFNSGVKTLTIRNAYSSAYTVKSLSRKTGYYIRVRTFKTIGKANYFSGWSALYGRKTK